MRTAVRVLEAAEAAVWYEARRRGLGAEFRSEFKFALDRLREGILGGTPWPGRLGELGVTRLLMQRFPFSVVFVATTEGSLCSPLHTIVGSRAIGAIASARARAGEARLANRPLAAV